MRAVLSIGQCSYDHATLSHYFHQQWGVPLIPAATEVAARERAQREDIVLILVNRIFDRDGADGVDLIQRWAAKEERVPLMLVSNYEEAQDRSVLVGGVRGFGKAELNSPATTELLRALLVQSVPESSPPG